MTIPLRQLGFFDYRVTDRLERWDANLWVDLDEQDDQATIACMVAQVEAMQRGWA